MGLKVLYFITKLYSSSLMVQCYNELGNILGKTHFR